MNASSDPHLGGMRCTTLMIRGMSCSNCVRKVSDALHSVPGVHRVEVSLEDGIALVYTVSDPPVPIETLENAVKASGFQGVARTEGGETGGGVARFPLGWRWNTVLAGAGAVVLMALPHFGFDDHGFLSLALALVVQILCGARFYQGAWLQARQGRSSMDTLVALGSTAAFAQSAVAVVFGVDGAGGHLFFSEAAAILAFISLGHWLESFASRQAQAALRALMRLAPDTACVVEDSGSERRVAVSQLVPGLTIRVLPGDRFPVDAEILEGTTEVDEAMLTGEYMPRRRGLGDLVLGGTANGSGAVLCRVKSVGAETALARIIAAVSRAQSSRAEVQALVDRVSNVFVPLVVVFALVVGCAWGVWPEIMKALAGWFEPFLWEGRWESSPWTLAWLHACAVLIVACPCAMGLATPAAMMAGANAGARRGILLRDARAIENAGKVDLVLFDKTGTLTQGNPEAVCWHDREGEVNARGEPGRGAPPGWWDVARELAVHSRHPASRAILAAGTKGGLGLGGEAWGTSGLGRREFWNVRELPGCGVEGIFADDPEVVFRLGSTRWLEESGVEMAVLDAEAKDAFRGGVAVVALARGRRLAGWVEFRDQLKPGVPEMIERLRRDGRDSCLVSGDRREAVESIARGAGFGPGKVFAEVRPEAKAELVRRMQEEGRRVAFVGDGLNDGPALAQATLGIAVSQASDVAREAADIVLLRAGVESVPEALELAARTLRTIRQNLVWAFFYNLLAIPLAALGFLSPAVCAAAMGLSDLMVIGNSLRLLGRGVDLPDAKPAG